MSASSAAVAAIRVALPGARIIPGPIGWAANIAAAVFLIGGSRPRAVPLPDVPRVTAEMKGRIVSIILLNGMRLPSTAQLASVAKEFDIQRLVWQDKMIRGGNYVPGDAQTATIALMGQMLVKARRDAIAEIRAIPTGRPPADRRACVIKNSRKQAREAAEQYSRTNGGPGRADHERGNCGGRVAWHFDPLGSRGEHIGPHFMYGRA